MKYAITVVFIFLALTSTAQVKTKKVKNKENKPWSTEVFYVLKDNREVKHGQYKKIGYSKEVLVEGWYKMGKKDSLWTTFNSATDKVVSKGFYSAGEKSGIWEYYDNTGSLTQKFDHSKNELVWLHEKYKNKKATILVDGEFIEAEVDQRLLFIGGVSELHKYISDLNYPQSALKRGESGTVKVRFEINKKGVAENHIIIESVSKDLDEYVLQLVRDIPNQWLPAIYNGEPVTSVMSLPFNFSFH